MQQSLPLPGAALRRSVSTQALSFVRQAIDSQRVTDTTPAHVDAIVDTYCAAGEGSQQFDLAQRLLLRAVRSPTRNTRLLPTLGASLARFGQQHFTGFEPLLRRAALHEPASGDATRSTDARWACLPEQVCAEIVSYLAGLSAEQMSDFGRSFDPLDNLLLLTEAWHQVDAVWQQGTLHRALWAAANGEKLTLTTATPFAVADQQFEAAYRERVASIAVQQFLSESMDEPQLDTPQEVEQQPSVPGHRPGDPRYSSGVRARSNLRFRHRPAQ